MRRIQMRHGPSRNAKTSAIASQSPFLPERLAPPVCCMLLRTESDSRMGETTAADDAQHLLLQAFDPNAAQAV